MENTATAKEPITSDMLIAHFVSGLYYLYYLIVLGNGI